MNYRIVEKEALGIIGIKKRVPIIFNGVNPEIASMWQSLNDVIIRELKELNKYELYHCSDCAKSMSLSFFYLR